MDKINTLIINDTEYVVIEKDTFTRMQQIVENYEDGKAFLQARADTQNGDDELIPFEIVQRLHKGDNPVRVWREHRGLTLEHLAAQIGLSASALSLIETNKRKLKLATAKNIADILNIDLDDLV